MSNLFHIPFRIRNYAILVFHLLVAITFTSIKSSGQGNLLLFPKRVVFEGNKKSQVLNVSNTGKDTVKYYISVVQIRMRADGSLETITQPDSAQYFADNNFRFFPRTVVLGPNESQTVKVQLVNTNKLVPGEYRSHLYFRAEPDKKPLGEEDSLKDSGLISVQLVAVFGISIPVIIRVGETGSSISFSNVSVKSDSIPLLTLGLQRTGNISAYGDIGVDHISLQGKVTRVGTAKGVAIYTPNPIRYFNLPLDLTKGIDYKKGKLHIAYTTSVETRSVKMADTELVLMP